MPEATTRTVSRGQNLRIWNTLAQLPGGRWLFSQAVCWKVPYFRSVHPTVTALEPGRCEVTAPNRRSSHNHLGTYHAIASCNLAELAGGLMTEATIPSTHRWIPAGMTVEYLAKAATDMRAVAVLEEVPDFGDQPFTLVVPVDVHTADGTVAVRARISMHVSPRK